MLIIRSFIYYNNAELQCNFVNTNTSYVIVHSLFVLHHMIKKSLNYVL